MIYGALLGDIIGSRFEFSVEHKTKEFELFTEDSIFTDDSVMTMAVAQAILEMDEDTDPDMFRTIVTTTMKTWGNWYGDVGYGYRFMQWLFIPNSKPYNSWGNGSAMRVSPVGWAFDSLEKTREFARASADVTHNHLEGIKGAEATASAIYLARTGATKEEIKSYIETEFGYDLDRRLDDIRPDFEMDESCQGTVPESIIAFLESTGFEDAIRNAVSLGGDTDTLGAITGGIAEAFYGVDEELKKQCIARIDDRMRDLLFQFQKVIK